MKTKSSDELLHEAVGVFEDVVILGWTPTGKSMSAHTEMSTKDILSLLDNLREELIDG